MTCLPQSGGCERPFTDAFAAHLNDAEGAHYVHQACLDILDRQHPQPEALYLDSKRNARLVIERKSISFPRDYARRHNNDHFVSDLFDKGLSGLLLDDLYEVRLPMLMDGTQLELRSFVQLAIQRIRSNWPRIVEGTVIGSESGGTLWWSCRRIPSWDRIDGAPSKGLQFTFSGPLMSHFDYVEAKNLAEDVISDLKKIFSGCQKKFASYSNARRVLVLDPFEELRYQTTDWWHDVFSTYSPPTEIDEVWSGIFDYVTDELQGWIFERLH
jgi:hypothetical protein